MTVGVGDGDVVVGLGVGVGLAVGLPDGDAVGDPLGLGVTAPPKIAMQSLSQEFQHSGSSL